VVRLLRNGTAAALVLGRLFFPRADPAAGTLLAFATFGAGFVVRPLGGVVFGHLGDRVGRRPVLVSTLLLVGLGTFVIGLLPNYAAIGVWAPVLLVACRLLQGFGAGAEYGGAVIYGVENAPPGRRGLFGGWAPTGVAIGQMLAVLVFGLFAALPEAQFLTWGWRVPFLLSLLLVGVGLWMRVRLMETPVFEEVARERKVRKLPVLDVVREQPRSFLVVIGARFAENGLGYLLPTWGLSYLTLRLGFSKTAATRAVTLGTLAEFLMVPVFAALSDRVGRRPVYAAAAAFCALFAVPFLLLLQTKSPPLVVLAMVVGVGVGVAGMFGPQAAYFAELFGPRVRYSGFATAREIGSVLSGGPAPALATLLVAWAAGAPWGVAAYIVLLSLITLVAVLAGPETFRADLRQERPDAALSEARPGVAVQGGS
jgi:MFS family permease